MTDEEVHAIAALLRGNSTIAELNLRSNEVLRVRISTHVCPLEHGHFLVDLVGFRSGEC